MAAKTLTERQKLIYDFIVQRIQAGCPPTYREVGRHAGITSPNGVDCHLEALEKKGLIRRTARTSRGIRLVEAEAIEAKRSRVVEAAVRYCEQRSAAGYDVGYGDLLEAVEQFKA